MTRGRIVVLGEHTPAGTRALRWAVDEAGRHAGAVVVVRPFDRQARRDLALEPDLERARRDSRYRTQSWVIEAVGDLDSAVPVSVVTPDGATDAALAAAAQSAELVVIAESGEEAERLAARLRPLVPCPVQVGLRAPSPA